MFKGEWASNVDDVPVGCCRLWYVFMLGTDPSSYPGEPNERWWSCIWHENQSWKLGAQDWLAPGASNWMSVKPFHPSRGINQDHVLGFVTKALWHVTWKCVSSLNSHQKALCRFLNCQSSQNSNQKAFRRFLGGRMSEKIR